MSPERRTPRRELDDFWEHLDRWSIFILANLLWAIFSIPVITFPAATAGLFATMSLWSRGKTPELFREFFGAMRRYWITSSLIVILDLVVGGLLVVNLSIFPLMEITNPVVFLSRGVTLFVGVVLVLVNLYVWPLLVTFDLPLRQLLPIALKLGMAHPLVSLGILLLVGLPVGISLVLPVGIFVFATFSASIFLWNWGTWRVIRRYVSDDNRQKFESLA